MPMKTLMSVETPVDPNFTSAGGLSGGTDAACGAPCTGAGAAVGAAIGGAGGAAAGAGDCGAAGVAGELQATSSAAQIINPDRRDVKCVGMSGLRNLGATARTESARRASGFD